jgi:hypothetical protein
MTRKATDVAMRIADRFLLILLFFTTEAIRTDEDHDIDFLVRDRNKDGKVSREEYGLSGGKTAPIEEAFACLDTDESGFVTKEEREHLRNNFLLSKISKLTTADVLQWFEDDKCVPVDIRRYIPRLEAGKITGPALWDICIRDPSLLLSEFKIKEANVRRTIIQVIPS